MSTTWQMDICWHLNAVESGESYILGGEDVSLKTMLAVIAELTGRRAPGIELPRLPLYPLAYAAEIAATLTGKEPFLTVDALKMAKHHMFFSSAKAARELGYSGPPVCRRPRRRHRLVPAGGDLR